MNWGTPHLANLSFLYITCENLPYGGTNSVQLDQMFSDVCDNIYGWNCTGSDKYICIRCSWAKNTKGPYQTPHIMHSIYALSTGPVILVPPLGRFSQMTSHTYKQIHSNVLCAVSCLIQGEITTAYEIIEDYLNTWVNI